MTSQDTEALLAAPRPDLVAAWIETMGQPPPPRLSRRMMARILANERQWEASGLSRADFVRKFARAAQSDSNERPTGQGTRLVREWNGRQYVVDVLPDGYAWNGQTYHSLSAIARKITGTKWSGPRFFGVAS